MANEAMSITYSAFLCIICHEVIPIDANGFPAANAENWVVVTERGLTTLQDCAELRDDRG